MSFRKEKIDSLVRELAGKFIQKRAKIKNGLITITRAEISSDLKNVKIFLTVYPENKEKEALKILESTYTEWRKYFAENFKSKYLPRSEFLIDKGEKSAMKIDELLK